MAGRDRGHGACLMLVTWHLAASMYEQRDVHTVRIERHKEQRQLVAPAVQRTTCISNIAALQGMCVFRQGIHMTVT